MKTILAVGALACCFAVSVIVRAGEPAPAHQVPCHMMQLAQHHSHQPATAPAAGGAKEQTDMGAASAVARAFAKDPICGMNVDADKAKAAGRTTEFQGNTYYFCTDACKMKFDKDPTRYISARP